MVKLLKSQFSVEFLLIMGFTTLLIIPLIIIFFTFTQETSDDINSAQLQQITREIVDNAESVYYLGEPSQSSLRVNIPNRIVLANLSGYEVVYKLKTKSGEVDIVQVSNVNITGSLPVNKSRYLITFIARSNHVEVSYE